jgi:hypothetical protein
MYCTYITCGNYINYGTSDSVQGLDMSFCGVTRVNVFVCGFEKASSIIFLSHLHMVTIRVTAGGAGALEMNQDHFS